MAFQPGGGQRFGRYEIGRRLGHGGMGVVHAATDTVLGREVALKLVAAHLADDDGFRARFAREAALLARLDSGRIVSIYDHGEQDGYLYIATQLVDGGDLTALLGESGPLPPGLAVHVVDQVLEALDDAHSVGITHRDVKPANVLLRRRTGRTEAFLCDFGIATTTDVRFTRTGGVTGSLSWMAPERHRGEDAGAAGDLYSAGCLLWFALTGAAPYAGTDVEIALGHLQGAVPQLPGHDELSTGINAVLTRAMAKEPAARYPSAAAMRADLARLATTTSAAVVLPEAASIRQPLTAPGAAPGSATVVRGAPPASPAAAAPPPPPRKHRRLGAVVTVAAVLTLVAGVVGASALLRNRADTTLLASDPLTTVPATASGSAPVPISPSAVAAGKAGKAGRTPHRASPGAQTAGVPSAAPPVASGAAPTSRPPAVPTSTAPQPAPTRHAPTYAYRCWSGRATNAPSTCGDPTGPTGARWIWGSFAACGAQPPPDSRIRELYQCSYGSTGVAVLRFDDPATARAYLGERLSGTAPDNWTTWYVGPQFDGYQALGEQTYQGTTTQRFVSYYNRSGITWGFLVAAPTAAARDNAVGTLVNRYARSLPQYQYKQL
jgi:hypothetical protein